MTYLVNLAYDENVDVHFGACWAALCRFAIQHERADDVMVICRYWSWEGSAWRLQDVWRGRYRNPGWGLVSVTSFFAHCFSNIFEALNRKTRLKQMKSSSAHIILTFGKLRGFILTHVICIVSASRICWPTSVTSSTRTRCVRHVTWQHRYTLAALINFTFIYCCYVTCAHTILSTIVQQK